MSTSKIRVVIVDDQGNSGTGGMSSPAPASTEPVPGEVMIARAFYPLTLPLTVGPGSVSVAVTLGANASHLGGLSVPNRLAAKPLSNAPTWFDAPMKIQLTDAMRPRRASGDITRMITLRMITLTPSVRPLKKSAATDR